MDDLVRKINELKKERGAVILAHNYQRPEVQDVADFVGDSLELSREATKIDAKVIVFCGVFFMAETAKLLSPDKIVLIPDPEAKCAMAEMIDVEGLRELKSKHPKAKVVCYVNSTADIKAECDACCTSSNAVSVVAGIDAEEIIFVPDKYLAAYVERQLKKSGVRRKIIPWNGFCPTHVKIIPNYLRDLKKKYPSALIITHPECTPDTNREADAVLSTSGMVKFVKETDADTVIVGTETGIIHKFKKEAPNKMFIPATELAVCPNMKMITLEKVYESLRDMKYEVKVDEKIAKKALKAIDEMMKYPSSGEP
ncbi:MAG: quinolinate synthase NadA [Candidatus Gracilibacteria bacterium]